MLILGPKGLRLLLSKRLPVNTGNCRHQSQQFCKKKKKKNARVLKRHLSRTEYDIIQRSGIAVVTDNMQPLAFKRIG